MKQSSIEWFAEKAFSPFITEEKYNELLLQAKMMHYSEIKNSYKKGYEDKDFSYFDPEHYYSETFKTKQNKMTEEEIIDLLSGAYVKFDYYYKYTFYFTGEIPDKEIKIECSFGGDSHDIYRLEVNNDPIKFLSVGEWTTVRVLKGSIVPEEIFYKDNSW